MITTLFSGDNVSSIAYYYSHTDNGRTLYCDALMPVEAACKYLLSHERVDQIIVLGSEAPGGQAMSSDPVTLREGASLCAADPKTLSRYDLLRCRLAEFVAELHPEDVADANPIPEALRQKIDACVRSFFENHFKGQTSPQPNRYFLLLAQDQALAAALHDALCQQISEVPDETLTPLVLHCLYLTMKDTCKMEVLEENLNTRIRYIPIPGSGSATFMSEPADIIAGSQDSSGEGADISICLQNNEASVTLAINNLINLANMMPDNLFRVCKTIATTCHSDVVANEICDVTTSQESLGLLSSVEAFLNNGKARGIVDYCRANDIQHPTIDRVVYALRNIDYGISLCDISDIERGIRSLRAVLGDQKTLEQVVAAAPIFGFVLECVRRDYGRLLETERIEFIDLVKWAYRKEFWQQTLTLIESRAPEVFVEKGFFYYCDSEEKREQVTRIFAQIYWDLRPYEKYKMNRVSHYFIKYCGRQKANKALHGREYVQSLAHARIEELQNTDPKEIRACSACTDPGALEDLLFAYYHIGDVRNATNHANESFDGFLEIMRDSDCSERMDTIRQAVDFFLHCYEKVDSLTNPENAHVVTITTEEILARTDAMREEFKAREK